MRAALFVDFDNISISFRELDETAAHRFATQPARWLSWLESGAHALAGEDGDDETEPARRRILLRRCYLNPVAFGRFRADYTRAAFSVIDCPPLTQRGKTSADVYMVMDILDALATGRYDEFVILSADADFTPVLLRLREYDRRTTIIATNMAAAAYKAACDNVVPYERFFEEALGLELETAAAPEPRTPPGAGWVAAPSAALLRRVARALRERVAANGPLSAREAPAVFAAFPEFRNSHWFGCFSLKALMGRLLQLEPALVMEGDPTAAWTVYLRDVRGAGARGETDADVGAEILAELRRILADAGGPMPMAAVASRLNERLGPGLRESGWLGHGTFKALLLALAAPDVAVLAVQPGYVYDPRRHDPASVARTDDGLGSIRADLAAFARRVAGVTGAPALPPAEYAALFRAIAAVAPAEEGGAAAGDLTRAVREMCREAGLEVGRAQASFVVTGLRYNGTDLTLPPLGLARAWAGNVRELCANAQLALTPAEEAMIEEWIAGGLVEPPEPEPGDGPAETLDGAGDRAEADGTGGEPGSPEPPPQPSQDDDSRGDVPADDRQGVPPPAERAPDPDARDRRAVDHEA